MMINKSNKIQGLILFCIALLTIGCQQETASSNTPEKAKTPVEKVIPKPQDKPAAEAELVEVNKGLNYDSLMSAPLHFFNEEIAVLQNYFSDSIICALDSNQFALNSAKTDTHLLNAYEKSLNVRGHMLTEFFALNLPNKQGDSYYPDYVLNSFSPIDEASFGLKTTCVAECTEFDFIYLLSDFINQSEKTEGSLDNEFFNLLSVADGQYGGTGEGWMEWFMRTWDYGGASLLGTGIHLNFLQKATAFQEKSSQFDELLARYKKGLYSDISHGVYSAAKESVINELNEIINLSSVTENEKKPLLEFMELLDSDSDSCKHCVGGRLQFNCETGNCDWGG